MCFDTHRKKKKELITDEKAHTKTNLLHTSGDMDRDYTNSGQNEVVCKSAAGVSVVRQRENDCRFLSLLQINTCDNCRHSNVGALVLADK